MTQRVVGLAVLERLRQLDPVSYVRFASVYKGFDDVGDFEREVVELQKSTAPKAAAPNAGRRVASRSLRDETLAITSV